MRIPIVELDAVFHVGTLDAKKVGLNSGKGSQEGNCLSVSLCPNAWQAIARLGGYATHRLATPNGAFLDALAVAQEPDLLEAIVDWGLSENLVESATRWRTWYFDDEREEWGYFLSSSQEAALDELRSNQDVDDAEDAEAPEGHQAIEDVSTLIGREALRETTGFSLGKDEDATDALLVEWARRGPHGLSLDGVWWNETHDPDSLSAPRGAILPECVRDWTASPVEVDAVDDDEELDAMPETEWIEISPSPRP